MMTRPDTCTHDLQTMAVNCYAVYCGHQIPCWSVPIAIGIAQNNNHYLRNRLDNKNLQCILSSATWSCSLHLVNQHWLDHWYQLLLENERFTLVIFYVLASFVPRGSMFLRKEPAISDFCMKEWTNAQRASLFFNCKLACDLDQLKHWRCHIANGFESKEQLNIFRSQEFKKRS